MNAISLFMNMIFVIVGLAGGYFIYKIMQKPVKRVDLLRPRDSRAKTLKVVQETDTGLTCKKVDKVTHRFIKKGPSWIYNEGGRMITKFFGIEGTAYTSEIEDGPITTRTSLIDHLKLLWGDKFVTIFSALPDEQRQAIETDVIGVTVEISKIDIEKEGLPKLTGDDIHDEGDNVMLGRWRKSSGGGKTIGRTIYELGGAMLLGALLMYFFITRGII